MKIRFVPLIFVLIFSACQSPKQKIHFDGYTQGTTYSITYFDSKGRNFQAQVDSLLRNIDNSVSIYKPNSVISQINNNQSQQADDIFLDNFLLSSNTWFQTDGAFDPTVGPLVNAWGFGPVKGKEISKEKIDSLLKYVGMNKVSREKDKIYKLFPEIRLDFNAIAQGYSVDYLAKFFDMQGISDYLIEIGGEVKAKGTKARKEPWRVGIEKPIDNPSPNERIVKAIVRLENKSLATSGNYHKFYIKDGVKYSHTIDPKTGYPVNHSLLSATVLNDTCAVADALATAFMVMGLEKTQDFVKKHSNIEVYLIYSDAKGNMQTYISEGLQNLIEE